MISKFKSKFNINFIFIIFFIFIFYFFNVLANSLNTTLILDFINLSFLSFILFYILIKSKITYMFSTVPLNYNAVRMQWSMGNVEKYIHGVIL